MLATRQQALVILQQVLATPQLALVSVTEIRIYSGKFLSDSFYNWLKVLSQLFRIIL